MQWLCLGPSVAFLFGCTGWCPPYRLGEAGWGVRPIAVAETLRRLAGKLLIARYQPEAASRLQPEQVGVGVLRGAESLVHKVRMWLQQALPNHVLLQLDFKNAFNSVKRKVLLQAVAEHCRGFSRTRLLATGTRVLCSQTGASPS